MTLFFCPSLSCSLPTLSFLLPGIFPRQTPVCFLGAPKVDSADEVMSSSLRFSGSRLTSPGTPAGGGTAPAPTMCEWLHFERNEAAIWKMSPGNHTNSRDTLESWHRGCLHESGSQCRTHAPGLKGTATCPSLPRTWDDLFPRGQELKPAVGNATHSLNEHG